MAYSSSEICVTPAVCLPSATPAVHFADLPHLTAGASMHSCKRRAHRSNPKAPPPSPPLHNSSKAPSTHICAHASRSSPREHWRGADGPPGREGREGPRRKGKRPWRGRSWCRRTRSTRRSSGRRPGSRSAAGCQEVREVALCPQAAHDAWRPTLSPLRPTGPRRMALEPKCLLPLQLQLLLRLLQRQRPQVRRQSRPLRSACHRRSHPPLDQNVCRRMGQAWGGWIVLC
jgi:hypothetical protein